MKDNWLKTVLKQTLFRPGAVRTIRFGPLRGMVYRVGDVTGLSPWYSGAEQAHQQAFQRLVKAGDIVIDVGANWGVHTLFLSRLVGPEGRVVAVEPYPPAYAELKWHVERNQCQNVMHRPLAIGHCQGAAEFVPAAGASQGKLAQLAPDSGQARLPVQVEMLDTLVKDLGLEGVDLIKVDVEGAEGLVLEGAVQLTERYRPVYVIDLHTPEQDLLVGQWFSDRGYRLARLSGPPIRRTDRGWPDPEGVWGSILAEPEATTS